jgi:hypothetical protein
VIYATSDAVTSWHEWLPLVSLAVAALVYTLRQGLEIAGKSPSANILRAENVDLVRRNEELEAALARHEVLIADLQREVDNLRKTNQEAVLKAIQQHEVDSTTRYQLHKEWINEIVQSFRQPKET